MHNIHKYYIVHKLYKVYIYFTFFSLIGYYKIMSKVSCAMQYVLAGYLFYTCMHVQSCPTLSDPKDHSLPGSSVHGIPQARILEWVAISFSRGSF